MKGTKKRQILALGLAAAMVVSNLGTAFAANIAGKPGSTGKNEEITVTLNASGGGFATASGGIEKSVKVTAVASDSNAAAGGYYAEFGEFRLATDSNAANADCIKDGPDEKPQDKEAAKFDGWYADLGDANTKLAADSQIFGDITAYARWIEEVTAIDDSLKADVKEVQVSGLSNMEITPVNSYTESTIKNNISRLALNESEESYLVSGEPLLLDIRADIPETPGMITMQIPESLSWTDDKAILVMHFNYDGRTLKEEGGLQEAVVDMENKTMTFTAGEFSPFAIVLAEKLGDKKPETVKVKVEDVPGGALIVYSKDEDGNVSLFPIGEEVTVPFGTELRFMERPMYLGDVRTMLEENEDGNRIVRVEMGGTQQEVSLSGNEGFPVTGDTVVSGTFWLERQNAGSSSTNQYWVDLRPYDWPDESKPYEGTLIVYEYDEDGRSIEVEGIRAELDSENPNGIDNDKFTVSGKQVKSKGTLDVDTYQIALNIFTKDGTQIIGTDEDGNRINSGTATLRIGVERSFSAWMAQYMRQTGDRSQITKESYFIGRALLGKEDGSSFAVSREAAFEEAGIKTLAMYGHDLDYWTNSKDEKIDEAEKLSVSYGTYYARFKDYTPVTIRPLNGADLFLETDDGTAYMKPDDTKTVELKGKDIGKVTDVEWRIRYGTWIADLESTDGSKAVMKANRTGSATIMAIVTTEGKDTTVVTKQITITESGEPEEPGQIDLHIAGESRMEVGTEQTLSLSGDYAANVRKAEWKAEDPSIVRIVEADNDTAKVSAAAPGRTRVVVSAVVSTDAGDKMVECTKSITVVEKGTLPGDDDKPGTNPGEDDKPGTNPGGDDKPGTTPGGSSGSGWVKPASGNSSNTSAVAGGWKRDNRGWMYLSGDGSMLKGQWSRIANVWYYFGTDGYMLTGWQFINGKWYYLTESEAGMGGMKTGWQYDDTYQAWFFFGADGAMLTGWQLINGAWYYLNPGADGTLGAMAADTQIGAYYVNAGGVWVQ